MREEAKMGETNEEWNDLVAEAVYTHLQGEGLSASRYERDTTVRTGWANLTCRCRVEQVAEHNGAAMAATTFETFLNDMSGRSIAVTLAQISFDTGPRAVVVQTVHQWWENVWPVIRRMVVIPTPHQEGESGALDPNSPKIGLQQGYFMIRNTDTRSGQNHYWLAAVGGYQILGNRSPEAAMRRIVQARDRDEYYMISALLFRASQTCAPGMLHWGNATIGRTPDGSRRIECLLDNKPWQEGGALLSEAPFPPATTYPGYLTFSQFFMLRPAPPEWVAEFERTYGTQEKRR